MRGLKAQSVRISLRPEGICPNKRQYPIKLKTISHRQILRTWLLGTLLVSVQYPDFACH